MEKIVHARTNAEFLNKTFGTNYKAWMKSRWDYDADTWVWMVRFDGTIRQGWRNRIVNANEIWEEYVGYGTPTYTAVSEKKYRIVVEIIDGYSDRAYRIWGKFKYDYQKSCPGKHVFVRVE